MKINNKNQFHFGLLVFVILTLIAFYMLMSNEIYFSLLFEFCGGTFLFLSIIKPKLVVPFYYVWLTVGKLMNKVTSPIILGLLYLLVLTPTSLILRLLKYDPLTLRSSDEITYWKQREVNYKISNDFKNQF